MFTSRRSGLLTRFGIYKLVRRYAARLLTGPNTRRSIPRRCICSSQVEINVIRGWLGYVSLDTSNRYAEINMRSKEAALEACQPPVNASVAFPRRAIWRDDAALLDWLTSL